MISKILNKSETPAASISDRSLKQRKRNIEIHTWFCYFMLSNASVTAKVFALTLTSIYWTPDSTLIIIFGVYIWKMEFCFYLIPGNMDLFFLFCCCILMCEEMLPEVSLHTSAISWERSFTSLLKIWCNFSHLRWVNL